MFPWSKSFEIFARIKDDNDMKVLRIFKGLLVKSPLKQGPLTAVPTYYEKIKKHGIAVLFVCALNVVASAPNPDTRNFSGKVSCESSKAFAKIKWYIRCEVLWHTFLRKKGVGVCPKPRHKGLFVKSPLESKKLSPK